MSMSSLPGSLSVSPQSTPPSSLPGSLRIKPSSLPALPSVSHRRDSDSAFLPPSLASQVPCDSQSLSESLSYSKPRTSIDAQKQLIAWDIQRAKEKVGDTSGILTVSDALESLFDASLDCFGNAHKLHQQYDAIISRLEEVLTDNYKLTLADKNNLKGMAQNLGVAEVSTLSELVMVIRSAPAVPVDTSPVDVAKLLETRRFDVLRNTPREKAGTQAATVPSALQSVKSATMFSMHRTMTNGRTYVPTLPSGNCLYSTMAIHLISQGVVSPSEVVNSSEQDTLEAIGVEFVKPRLLEKIEEDAECRQAVLYDVTARIQMGDILMHPDYPLCQAFGDLSRRYLWHTEVIPFLIQLHDHPDSVLPANLTTFLFREYGPEKESAAQQYVANLQSQPDIESMLNVQLDASGRTLRTSFQNLASFDSSLDHRTCVEDELASLTENDVMGVYIQEQSEDKVWGGQVEIIAANKCFPGLNYTVVRSETDPRAADDHVALLFYTGDHYDGVLSDAQLEPYKDAFRQLERLPKAFRPLSGPEFSVTALPSEREFGDKYSVAQEKSN